MYLSTATIDTATATFTAPQLTRAVALYAFDSFKPPSKGDSQLQRWSSLIGIVTAIVGNILISFALNIQRYAHIRLHEERNQRKEKSKSLAKASQNGYGATSTNGDHRESRNGQDAVEEDPHLQSSFHSDDSQSTACSDNDHEHDSTYLKSPYWWGGIILMTIGEAGNFLAYGFAPASIVSPLGVVALISNCVIAPIMLKERFRLRDFWGVVVAVAGAVTVVLSAKQQEKKLGPHEILEAVTTTAFEAYMAVTICLMGALMWASPKYGSRTILIDLGLVGLFGGYTALSTKGVASMLSSTLWRALTTPITYVLVIILVGTAIMQVKYVNKALQRFDSTQVIPVQFVMFTLSVIMGSAILYRDFEKATAENVGKFIGGCLLTFFGVWLITSGRSRNDGDEEEESDEEGEQRISLANQDLAGNYSDGSPRNPSIQRKPVFFQNGDSTNDEAIEDSRRSSRVSFVEPSPKVARAQSTSTSSNRGPIQVLTTAPSPEQEVPGTEETPLLRNPWKNTSEELLQAARHPGMSTTISSPVLPSEAQSSGESSKPPYARSSTQENPHTHPNHQQGPTPPNPDRPYTPARHSISRMMPGPLLSPLSGGLSVVIADSLRRGVESPLKSRPFKRTRLGLRRTKSGSQKLVNTSSGSEEVLGSTPGSSREPPQEISKSLDQEGGNWSGITRARSLSNTLGELFRGKRQKTDRSDIADEEAGSSGS